MEGLPQETPKTCFGCVLLRRKDLFLSYPSHAILLRGVPLSFFLAFAIFCLRGVHFSPNLQFNFDVYACRQIQLCQRVCRLGCRAGDVDQSLVSSLFELLSGIFVLVYRSQNGNNLFFGRKRNRSRYFRASFLGSFHNFRRTLIQMFCNSLILSS